MQTRVGFIGAGGIASRHIGDLLQFEDVKITAVADVALERAREQAERCGAQIYTDLNQMLDRERLDAVYICVPPFAHGEPEYAAITRGLPFFVEKPLARNWAIAHDIARLVEAKQIITGVGYHWRYLDTTEQARELLNKNPARLALGYWLDFTPPPAWWGRQDQSGGQMVEQTTHIFDLARVLVGDVFKVYGAARRNDRPAYPNADVADVSVATLHFANGALGSMASTCILNWPHRIGLHLFAESMAIELTEFGIMVDVGHGRPTQKAQGDPFLREDRDFIDAVQGKPNRIRVPYAEALKTHLITTTVMRSAAEGRALEIDPQVAYA